MICISFRSSEGKSSVSLCLFLSSSSQHRLGQHRKRQILKSAVFHKSEPHGTVQHALQAPRLQFQQYSQSNWIHNYPQRIQNIVRGETLVIHNSGEPSRQENDSSPKERLHVWEIVCLTSVQQLDSVWQNVVEKGGGGELLSSAQVKQDPTEGGG